MWDRIHHNPTVGLACFGFTELTEGQVYKPPAQAAIHVWRCEHATPCVACHPYQMHCFLLTLCGPIERGLHLQMRRTVKMMMS